MIYSSTIRATTLPGGGSRLKIKHKKTHKTRYDLQQQWQKKFSRRLVDLWWLMVFNTTFNNISIISLRLILLVKDTRVPGENNQPVASDWQTLSHNDVSSTPKSNYHMITIPTAPSPEGTYCQWLLMCLY